jgi:putative autoinducer-2 (AI-2) aldolase
MGRNIFQAEDPISMIKAVRAVVHEKHTPEEAFKLYNELRKKGK